MKIKLLFASVLMIALAVFARSARAQAALPASFGAWSATGAATKTPANQLQPLAGDNAAVLQEYGIDAAERRDFSQGAQATTITLYDMVDPSAAYGAFTFLRDPQMAPLSLGDAVPYAVASRDHALVVVGNLLFDIEIGRAHV